MSNDRRSCWEDWSENVPAANEPLAATASARNFWVFSDPRNLEKITPPWLRFEILSPSSLVVARGTRIDYRLRIRGLPIRWQSAITLWEPPLRFVDQQTRGPYRVWIHEHTFSGCEDGTIAGDSVVYAAPGGKLVQKWLIEPDLAKIFHYRHQVLQEIFNPKRLQPSTTRLQS